MTSTELTDLTELFSKQNGLIESLEKELTDLFVKNKNSQDPNAAIVKQLTAENSQLKSQIEEMRTSLKSHVPTRSAPVFTSSNNLTFEEKYELISRNLQEIVGADRFSLVYLKNNPIFCRLLTV